MSDSVTHLPQPILPQPIGTSSTQGTDGATATSAAAGTTPPPTQPAATSTSQYEGSSPANKYAGSPTTSTASQFAKTYGFYPSTDAQLKQAADSPAGQAATGQITQIFNNLSSDPNTRQGQVRKANDIAFSIGSTTGISPQALIQLALQKADEDKSKDLSGFQNHIDQLQVVAQFFSNYNTYLQGIQQQLDAAAAGKSGNDKDNVDVVFDKQYDLNASTFDTLNSKGEYTPVNTVDGKSDKDKKITNKSFNTRLTFVSQQRDLLQKDIDKWTQKFQNGLQQQNTLRQEISELIKNQRDTGIGAARNI